VVIIIDALRYDFAIPFDQINKTESYSGPKTPQAFHNALPFLYETAIKEPHNAFLRPFIADPPTTTLQRLKGLTTGTLPTFIDAGSNFAGEAIEEDNLLIQLRNAGRRIAHLGDDTWLALFPGYFEPNISRAYDSFNVPDLHTVDNGVTKHILPLLSPEKKDLWDVTFAHFLGVDHAGHRYGPNHFAMTTKLQQMDDVLRKIVAALDEETLLVVMGDHGMDQKGDHGGESDDEVEAALWMYSKKGVFGRTDPKFVTPPPAAKVRPVDQIDLVPTLSLLLGLPIPFNNLGKPIEEAFVGQKGSLWDSLAAAVRMAAAGTKRYQSAYYKARGIDEAEIKTTNGSPRALWAKAEGSPSSTSKERYHAFSIFQIETLRIFRDLWARFDVPCMILGIAILATGVASLILYVNENAQDGPPVDDAELEKVQRELELKSLSNGDLVSRDESSSRKVCLAALIGSLVGSLSAPISTTISGDYLLSLPVLNVGIGGAAIGGLLCVLYVELSSRTRFSNPMPKTVWGWLAFIFAVSQSIGFASNSYTIWEDSILLFFTSTFGLVAAISSLRIEHFTDRTLGVYHSVVFIALGWAASFSKLCREEQMPYCQSTYYASAMSSTSATWTLLIPFILAIGLPSIIKSYYAGSRSYEAFAPVWIGWAFRFGLVLNALYWIIDAADDGAWIPGISQQTLKSIRIPIAQTVFAMAIGGGSVAFGYAPPCVSISATAAPTPNSQMVNSSGATVTILGFANAHGSRYFLIVINIILCVVMVQETMGGGAIALMSWQILSLLEILDLNSLTTSPIGPIVLSLLGSFYFFKTGHQATPPSIQWDSAFIALDKIRYPWSPLLVTLNSFGAQILAVAAVPLVVLWKQKPRTRGVLRSVATAMAWHTAYYAVIGLATAMWAGHLRRHLMLYRIFSPKFMTASAVLLVVDVIGILVTLTAVRFNSLSIAEVFGWA
jgi:phosphatidylinositol glycan class O